MDIDKSRANPAVRAAILPALWIVALVVGIVLSTLAWVLRASCTDRNSRRSRYEPSSGHRVLTDGGNADPRHEQRERIAAETGLSRDVAELIRFILQETRYTLVTNMLAHPKQAPSLNELEYLYPDKGRTTIVEALEKLVRWGFVDKLVIPPGKRKRSLPNTFFRVSDVGYRFLEQTGLLPNERELQQRYQELPTEEVSQYEEAPRKDAVVDYSEVDERKVAQLKAIVDSHRPEEARENESALETFLSAIFDFVPFLHYSRRRSLTDKGPMSARSSEKRTDLSGDTMASQSDDRNQERRKPYRRKR